MIRRVAVLGCGGAGRTVLARQIGDALRLPVVHGDLHRAEWEAVHDELIARDEWVIDAMRLGTLDARLARADAAVFVDRGAAACLAGLARRRLRYRGGLHPDSGAADFVNWEFVQSILTFRRRHRPRILELLSRHAPTTRMAVVRSYAESDALVARWAACRTAPIASSVRGSTSRCRAGS